eukprot:1376869-Pleurochrysis_carterae.AAC.3
MRGGLTSADVHGRLHARAVQICGGHELHAQAAQTCVSKRTDERVHAANLGMCIRSGSMFAQTCMSMECPCGGHGRVPAAHMSRCAEE